MKVKAKIQAMLNLKILKKSLKNKHSVLYQALLQRLKKKKLKPNNKTLMWKSQRWMITSIKFLKMKNKSKNKKHQKNKKRIMMMKKMKQRRSLNRTY